MREKRRKDRRGILVVLIFLMMSGGVEMTYLAGKGYAIPTMRGFYFLNDQYNDSSSTHNNFTSTGVSFNLQDHLFTKNRLGLTLSLPYTRTRGSGRSNDSFAPQGIVNVTGKDYTFSLTHGIVRNFDPLVGERSSRNTGVSVSVTPPKFIPLFGAYREDKSIAGPDRSTVRNYSASTDFRIHPFHLNGGVFKQETVNNLEGDVSDNDGAFARGDATFFLFRDTVLHASYDVAENDSRFKESRSSTDSRTLSLFLSSSPYYWMNISGSYVKDNSDGKTDTVVGGSTFFTDQELYDVTLQLIPVGGWAFSVHRGHSRTNSTGEVSGSDILAYSLNVAKQVTETVDGSLSITRTENDDQDRGEFTSTSVFATANMIVSPALLVRVNHGLTKGELAEESDENLPKTGNYTATTNVDVTALPTRKLSMALHYSASEGSENFRFFGTATQNIGGTLTYIPKASVIYTFSTFQNFARGRSSTSAYNGSMTYSFYKTSRMTLAYMRSDGEEVTDNSVSGNFLFSLPKQTSLTLNFSVSGINSGNEATSLTVQFSIPL